MSVGVVVLIEQAISRVSSAEHGRGKTNLVPYLPEMPTFFVRLDMLADRVAGEEVWVLVGTGRLARGAWKYQRTFENSGLVRDT